MNDNEQYFKSMPLNDLGAEEPTVVAPAAEEPTVVENAWAGPQTWIPEQEPVTPPPVTPEKPKKAKSRMLPVIIGAGVAFVVIVALLVGLLTSSPLGLIGTGAKNSMKALEKNDVLSLVNDVANGGSIELMCDVEELCENLMGYPMLEGNASVKLYTDLSKTAAAVVAGYEIDGSDVLDLSVFADKDAVAVKSAALLGKDVYGIGLKNVVENLENSEFGPDGEFDMGLDLSESANDVAADAEKMAKDSQKLSADIVGTFLKSLKKNSEIDKESTTVEFNNKDVRVTAVTVSLDHEQVANVMMDMLEYARTDKGVREFITENMAYLLYASGYSYVDDEDIQDYIDEFYAELDYICEEEMEYLQESLEDARLSVDVTFYVTKSGKQLVGMEMKVKADGETVKASVFAGPDLADVSEIRFRVSVDDRTTRGSYVVKTNDKKEFLAELKITDYYGDTIEGEITHDKSDGDFDLWVVDSWGDEYAISGDLKKSGKKVAIRVDTLIVESDRLDLGVDVVLNTSDKVPSVPKYTDLLKMDADSIEDLVDQISETYEDLMYSLY